MSIYWLTIALVAPIVGRLVDRHGSRRLMCFGALILGLAFCILSVLHTTWHLYGGYFLDGIGAAAMTQVPAAAAVANWFDRRRGMAMAATLMGMGFGGTFIPPLLSHVIFQWGWRMGYLAIALAMVLLTLPVVALVVRTRPVARELPRDGGDQPGESATVSPGQPELTRPAAPDMVKVHKTPVFWMVAASFFLASLGGIGIGTHEYAFLTDLGWPLGTAALAISLYGLFAMVGKLLIGAIADRTSPSRSAAICFAFLSACLLLVLAVKVDPVVWLFVVIYGLGTGGISLVRPLVAVEVFGLGRFGAVYGLITGLASLGSVVGPLFAGYVFDITGSYDTAFAVCALTFALAAVAIWLVRRRSMAAPQGLDQS